MTHPLKKWRLDEGLTLEQAGKKINKGAMTFYRFETAKRIPDKKTMPVVCATSGLQPNDFYRTVKTQDPFPSDPKLVEGVRTPP